jgi:hypothetical protein
VESRATDEYEPTAVGWSIPSCEKADLQQVPPRLQRYYHGQSLSLVSIVISHYQPLWLLDVPQTAQHPLSVWLEQQRIKNYDQWLTNFLRQLSLCSNGFRLFQAQSSSHAQSFQHFSQARKLLFRLAFYSFEFLCPEKSVRQAHAVTCHRQRTISYVRRRQRQMTSNV